jgi:chloramphenicol 3-O phosphotransferase
MKPPPTAPGQVILLNGVSSSGKSSIAGRLLPLLDRPYFHMAVDMFGRMRAVEPTARLSPAQLDVTLARTRAGFHRAVAGMAHAGNDIVMDHVLSEPWRLRDCLDVLTGIDVVFVGVHCSAGELARREHARGDRVPGQAAAQLVQVHAPGIYDLECDTTATGPDDCAAQIVRFLTRRPAGPTAFDRLRAMDVASSRS